MFSDLVFYMKLIPLLFFFFFFNDTATTEIYTLSLHDALPIWLEPAEYSGKIGSREHLLVIGTNDDVAGTQHRSEEHTSELQSQSNLVCRLLLEKKKKNQLHRTIHPTTTLY